MRRILHVDMDAFYASVEELDDPTLRGRPIIVGADPKGGRGRGVVAACSYPARKFGIHSALPISRAWQLCPSGVYVRPRFKRYQEISRTIMAILSHYTDLVEPLSVDEAFLDVSGSTALLGPAELIARDIKDRILSETGLMASVGVAPNKFLAKIASDLEKPDGFVVVPDDGVRDFLDPLPISRLWGVGPKTAARLGTLGARNVSDLAAIPKETLIDTLGVSGEHLWHLARGQDDRKVTPDWEPKSISSETTFDKDTGDVNLLIDTLRSLSDQVARRLRRQRFRAGLVTLKLRYASFTTHTKQTSVAERVETGDDVFRLALRMFKQFPLAERVRLIGVGTGMLTREGENPEQLTLFSGARTGKRLARTVDEIQDRFGDEALRRGSELS